MFYEVEIFKGEEINYKNVLQAYVNGVFPMGDEQNSNKIKWYYTDPRGIISLNSDSKGLHITRSMKQVLKKNQFTIKIDTAFNRVILKCAERENTWINEKIIELYNDLHKRKFAHSIEVFLKDELVGGLYGVEIKNAFFGESMFSDVSNASKVAVIYLYNLLKQNNFTLFDIQMITPVFRTFGAISISFEEYLKLLKNSVRL